MNGRCNARMIPLRALLITRYGCMPNCDGVGCLAARLNAGGYRLVLYVGMRPFQLGLN